MTFVLSLFVPHLSVFWCLVKSVLREYFSYFSQKTTKQNKKQALIFHADCLRGQSALNVKAYFSGKKKKISICRLLTF